MAFENRANITAAQRTEAAALRQFHRHQPTRRGVSPLLAHVIRADSHESMRIAHESMVSDGAIDSCSAIFEGHAEVI
jgi:hypothetical protein